MKHITDKYLDLTTPDLIGVTRHASCERFMQRVFGVGEIDRDSILAGYVKRMILDHLFDLGLVKKHADSVERAVAILGKDDEVAAIAFLKEDRTNNYTFVITTVYEDVPHDMDDLESYLTDRGFVNV